MAISNILANSSVSPSSAVTYNNSNSSSKPRDILTNGKDTLTLSQKARTLSNENVSSGDANNSLPLEAYALPDWLANLQTDYTRVDSEIGISYTESQAARYDSLSNSDKEKLHEYQSILNDYFQEALHNRNINNSVDYYHSFVKDDLMSEEVHQDVRQRLDQNSRAVELMQLFGIT